MGSRLILGKEGDVSPSETGGGKLISVARDQLGVGQLELLWGDGNLKVVMA